MSEQIKLSALFPVSPKQIYNAWLNGKEHAAMTGANATASAKVGGKFKAWDEYITGINLELIPHKRILQSWRSTEFPEKHLDSYLLVKLEEAKGGTKVTLVHSEIPDGQSAEYKKGWKDFYFNPMKAYFAREKSK
jgi:activator of HSP90 ATPase